MKTSVLSRCALISLAIGLVALPAPAQDISLDAGNRGRPVSLDNRAAGEVLVHALTLAGLRYSYGEQSVSKGMDCSALVQHVFREAMQQELPRTSEEQSRIGDLVLRHELEPGDLVFFNTQGPRFSHVGIYVGEGRFVHSPAAGGAIRMESMDKSYWKTRYTGARRVRSVL